jgi:hypothetical protein
MVQEFCGMTKFYDSLRLIDEATTTSEESVTQVGVFEYKSGP